MRATDGRTYELQLAAAGDVSLILPTTDVANPEFSIVIPALDEEITIGCSVDWCKEGIAAAVVEAEILIVDSSIIVDSSSDLIHEIAVSHGARVLKTPRLVAGVTLSINSMLLFLVVAILGLQLFLMGGGRAISLCRNRTETPRWLTIFSYTRTAARPCLLSD
jgi:hypothetical protein